MHSKGTFFMRCVLILTLCLTLACALMLLGAEGSRLDEKNTFAALHFQGEIRVDGGPWSTFSSKTRFDMRKQRIYDLRGSFDQDVELNHLVMMRLSNLFIKIRINGQEVFSFGSPSSPSRASTGNAWHSFTSQGISTNDLVEISLGNVCTGRHTSSFHQFFNQLYYGSSDGLIRMVQEKNDASILIALLVVCLGIFQLIAAVAHLVLRPRNLVRIFYSAGFCFFSGIWCCIQFNIISLIFPHPIVVNFVDIISGYLMILFACLYLKAYLSGKRRIATYWVCAVLLFYIFIALLSRIFFAVELYDSIFLGGMICFICLITCLWAFLLEYKAEKTPALQRVLYSLLPLAIGILLDTVTLILIGPVDTRWLRISLLIFVVLQEVFLVLQLDENAQKAAQVEKMEKELAQSRIAVMLGQIQPHFIFNTLTAIHHLCRENPPLAEDTVLRFSNYLRGNLASLTSVAPIPFSEELAHVEHYLAIEQLRFQALLQVKMDLETQSFFLPALTLQTLVENAVHHGLGQKEEGGCVTIVTREEKNHFLLIVEDDGLGFEPSAPLFLDPRPHVGLENVKNRLSLQCHASLTLESAPGKGTKIIIRIPKEVEIDL